MSNQEPLVRAPVRRIKKGTIQMEVRRRSRKNTSKKGSLLTNSLRDANERAVEQAENAFGELLDAANNSLPSIPHPAMELSKLALAFTEQNIKAAFDHNKKAARANDFNDAMKLQTEFVIDQFASFGEQVRAIGEVFLAATDTSKD